MRKGIIAFMSLLFVVVFAACGNEDEPSSDQKTTTDVEETMEEDVKTEREEDETMKEEETEEVKDCNETATKSETGGTSASDSSAGDCEDEEKASETKNDGWKKPDKIDNMDHLEIVHLAYDIFEAQDRKDYDFLESVAAEGTIVDRNNDKFKFENVTYPFEMDFFAKEDLGNLEFRYTHEEDGIVYVGFGAIDYENESSFVVDFEFVDEGGKWKLRSMDINK